jgi:hypothetical protein
LQHSLSLAQLAPLEAPEGPPQVLSHVPQPTPPQQSEALEHEPPGSAHALAHAPFVHTSEPQQSLSFVHVSPVPRQPHVPLPLHTLGAQQSALVVQAVPDPAHPHVDVLVSQLSAPQQSALLPQPWPLVAHPQVPLAQIAEQQSDALEHDVPSALHELDPPSPPVPLSTHLLVAVSHVPEPQQSSSVLQSPPTLAQAGAQVPLAQLPEQQSPFWLQQSWSTWQFGSLTAQDPASAPPPASVLPPLPLPLPPPLLLLPEPASFPPFPEPVPAHLPAVHDREQHCEKVEHAAPFASHALVPHVPFAQSLLQQSVLVVQVWPSGLHVGAGAAQAPPVQVLLQHSLPLEQLWPLAEHDDVWHVPETQSLLQQSPLPEQLAPRLAHEGWPQVPLVQLPLQQSLEV